jgi:hypothetical protein
MRRQVTEFLTLMQIVYVVTILLREVKELYWALLITNLHHAMSAFVLGRIARTEHNVTSNVSCCIRTGGRRGTDMMGCALFKT